MTGFFMFLHAFISILLVVIILMQSGRGGGLTESFASAESMFGAQTNEFMIKATTVIATLFLLTSLGLAILSAQKGKSLMAGSIITEDELTVVDDIIIPAPSDEDSIVVSDVKKFRDQTEAIPIETGAEETRSGVFDALPFATQPKSAPEAEPW